MLRKTLSSASQSRTAFVGLLLVGALALTGALAWQVVDAGRSHEEVAHKAVKEQALFAAWEFSNNARRFVTDKVVKPGLDAVARNGGKELDLPLTHPATHPGASFGTWEYGDTAAGTFFRVELEGGASTLAGPDDPGLAHWLETAFRTHLRNNLGDGWGPLMADPGDGEGLVAYRTYPEGLYPEVAYGYRLHFAGLAIPLGYAFEDPPLLPEALTEGHDNATLFSVAVTRADGREIWNSRPRYVSGFTASDTMGATYAGMQTVLTVNPAMAEALTIGGFPTSRLPLAVGLLLLTGGLVAAAYFQLRQEAELSQLRADFVSGVSHELRTPVAQIRMFAETLLLGRVRNEEERTRSLEIIVNESQRLTHQVENVLLYSRTERDALKVCTEPLDLGTLVEEVAEAFQPLAWKVRSRVRVDTTPGLIAEVDGGLVRQVLLNLLDNAVKYGPVGQMLELGAGRAPGGRILLWVEDQGPGIPPEERERIFAPYYRLEAHRESAVAGSGIGLSVVRQVMEALGGKVRVESGESGGARFVLDLPRMGGTEDGGRGAEGARRGTGETAPREPRPSGAAARGMVGGD